MESPDVDCYGGAGWWFGLPRGGVILYLARDANQVTSTDPTDPFDLARFVSAQDQVFDQALAELSRGKKESHWMWFIFPQVEGLGSSPMARKYAIRSLDEARAYMNHPILRPRLLQCCRALLLLRGKAASEIMGSPDDLKLRSSMTLFSLVTDAHPEFRHVLEKYYDEQPDPRTLEIARGQS